MNMGLPRGISNFNSLTLKVGEIFEYQNNEIKLIRSVFMRPVIYAYETDLCSQEVRSEKNRNDSAKIKPRKDIQWL